MNCPTTETLEQLALGFLEDPAPVRTHAAACPACTERLKVLVADHGALAAAAKDVRLPKVPVPSGTSAVSAWTSWIDSYGTPSRVATICGKTVLWACPWVCAPVNAVIRPSG